MSRPAPEPAIVALDRRMTEGFNLIHRELAAQRAEHAALRALIADLGAKIEEQGRQLNARIEEQGQQLNTRIEEQGRQLGARIERNRTEIHDVRAEQRELRGEVRALRRTVWTVMGGTLLLVIGLLLAAALSPALGSLFGK